MKKQSPPAPKGRPRQFDVDAALDAAMRVFWTKGFLGTSLCDLTEAMGINRPSLYAAFGNKEELFRKALERYHEGPASYLREALAEPTARGVVEKMLRGGAEKGTGSCNPRGCLWVHGVFSCGDSAESVRSEMAKRRMEWELELEKRFRQAKEEGELPPDADASVLAQWVITLNFGLAVQAACGATCLELSKVVDLALEAWPAVR